MLSMATDMLEAAERKSQAQFGFVPPLPTSYSFKALRIAYNVEKATGKVILNPFCLDIKSLADADENWLNDRNLLYEWLDYAKENAKTGETIKKLGL